MVTLSDPPTVGVVFSAFVITSNILSNAVLARSFYSLYFLQLSYQIAHALRTTNNFTKFNQLSFFEFYSSYQCLDYAECLLSSALGMALAVIAILVSIFLANKSKRRYRQDKKQAVLFERDSKYGYLFYTLLALLEWVQIPMFSNICYLFQQMSSPATVGVAFCSACLTVAAFFSSIYAIKACSYSENELLEKKTTWALFTLISLTIFGIHSASPGFGETSSTFAAYFLVAVLVCGLHNISKLVSMNTLTPLAVFISELHTINLSCQAVCFLIVVNQLEYGELSDNENDSLLIFLTIIFDLVFVAIELWLFEQKTSILKKHGGAITSIQSSNLSNHGQLQAQQNFEGSSEAA